MELACTKKLLDYIGIKAEKVSPDRDPLFGWTANLVVINRRKVLVAVNGASRCGFVLYGLTAKQLPRLPELVLNGIRALLESEYVRPEIIQRYLDDLGREVTFRANSSRSDVANCNKFCERLSYIRDLWKPGDLYQRKLLPWINNDVLIKGKYIIAYEALIGCLKARYGEDIRSCRALTLDVTMDLHTPCRRRIIVPETLDFQQLHHVLQHCFEWKDCHMHQFVTAVDDEGYPKTVLLPPGAEDEEWGNIQVRCNTELTLRDVFTKQKAVVYEYDFGDGWQHLVELCGVIEDCTEPWPRCIMAVGNAPMEDCGGPEGFRHIMEVLKDPSHPEFREISEWVRESWWHPLDVERINRWIQDAHRNRE